jgi:hypothetical protein
MQLVRRLILLTTLAVSAAALAAPAALTQTEPMLHRKAPRLVVQQEVHAAADSPCTAVTPVPAPVPGPLITAGGCRLHVSAPSVATTVHLSAGGAEVVSSTCAWEFDVRIDTSAEGYFAHQELTGPPATCPRRPCGQTVPPTGEGRAWSMFMRENEPGPAEEVWFLYCLENRSDGTNPQHCEVEVPISQPTLHRYRLTAVDVSGHGLNFPHCELDGTFDVEAVLENTGEGQLEQNAEIRHT